MQLTLTRDTKTPELLLGILEVEGHKFHTLEPVSSAVPAGQYRVRAHRRPSGEQCFEITCPQLGVYESPLHIPPSRRDSAISQVHIRAGEFWWHVDGSIALGKNREHTVVKGAIGAVKTWRVTESLSAMNELRTVIGRCWDIQLVVIEGGAAKAAA